MKARALLLIMSFASAPAVNSFGQVDCLTSTKLACQFPYNAYTLVAGAVGFGPAGIAAGNALTASAPINASIATQLNQLPLPSATVGTEILQQSGNPNGAPYDNSGTVLTDRPDLVGKGHLYTSFSYQHFSFNSVDGVNLGSLHTAFSFNEPSPFNSNDTLTYYGQESNKISLTLDRYVGLLTYGITTRTDISVIVPINTVSLGVTSSAFNGYEYDAFSGTYTNESPAAGTPLSSSGSASGIGDIALNFKQLLLGGEKGGQKGGEKTEAVSLPAIAVGASFRIPSGDSLNYLGSGAIGGSLYGLFEYRRRMSPHLKLSYQWNGVSQAVDLQQSPRFRLAGGLEYAVGADLLIIPPLTVSADLLGTQFVNAPSFALNVATLNPAPPPGSGISKQYYVQSSFNSTYSPANFSAGLKWRPKRYFLLYGCVEIQVNNVGLRSDPVPSFGIAYNFGKEGP